MTCRERSGQRAASAPSCALARAGTARLRAHGATRLPLGHGNAARYTRSCCLIAERPVVAGVQPSYRWRGSGPATHVTGRRFVAGQRLHGSVLSRGAHTVPPMPVATCVSNRSELRSASVDHEGHGERLTRQRSRLTALGSCGESPYDAAVRCCGRCGSCDTVTRGCTRWSARGRRALLNDFARQGNPRFLSHSQAPLDCQGGRRALCGAV